MSADSMANWRTSIAKVVSTESEEEILVRGRKMSDLIGSVSFAEMMFLRLTGKEATKPQARVLDALLVASIEHGIAPPSMIARCYASYGTSIQAAMAGGIMAFANLGYGFMADAFTAPLVLLTTGVLFIAVLIVLGAGQPILRHVYQTGQVAAA